MPNLSLIVILYGIALCLRNTLTIVDSVTGTGPKPRYTIGDAFLSEDVIDFLAVRTKGGIFYSKIAKTDLLKLLKKNNKKIVWLDEEAGILVSDKLFFEYRLTQTASNLIDILCFWTKQQRSYYLENFKSKNKKTLFTGSVRQDLLLNIKKERKSHKNYKQKSIKGNNQFN